MPPQGRGSADRLLLPPQTLPCTHASGRLSRAAGAWGRRRTSNEQIEPTGFSASPQPLRKLALKLTNVIRDGQRPRSCHWSRPGWVCLRNHSADQVTHSYYAVLLPSENGCPSGSEQCTGRMGQKSPRRKRAGCSPTPAMDVESGGGKDRQELSHRCHELLRRDGHRHRRSLLDKSWCVLRQFWTDPNRGRCVDRPGGYVRDEFSRDWVSGQTRWHANPRLDFCRFWCLAGGPSNHPAGCSHRARGRDRGWCGSDRAVRR